MEDGWKDGGRGKREVEMEKMVSTNFWSKYIMMSKYLVEKREISHVDSFRCFCGGSICFRSFFSISRGK